LRFPTVIVGRPGDQPRPQDPEGPLQKLESFALFDIFGRQFFYRHHLRESGLAEPGPSKIIRAYYPEIAKSKKDDRAT
jgi:hypothetical protein